ncbi:MAG: response regulator [Candidatus Melainabacteria bacterium]
MSANEPITGVTETLATGTDFQSVLIIGQPDEALQARLVERFNTEQLISCSQLTRTEHLEAAMAERLPDLIVIQADRLSEAAEAVTLCHQLRSRPFFPRPTVVVLCGGPEDERIACLMHGADDVLPPDLSADELAVRLMVHLRRSLDTLLHETTRLPGLPFITTVFERRLARQPREATADKPWALLSLEINHLNVYREAYGELPTRQVLKTLTILLGQYVMMPDCVAQTDNHEFLILTQADRAAKLAAILCRQFDTAAPNFYSEKDRKQGYMIAVMPDKVSRRVPLLTLAAGLANGALQPVTGFHQAYNTAGNLRRLAKTSPVSHCVAQRPSLPGGEPADGNNDGAAKQTGAVLVVESDPALSLLLQTTLRMEGFPVTPAASLAEAEEALAGQTFSLVILDALLEDDAPEEARGLALCRSIKAAGGATRVLCISTLHNREKVLGAGADLYLPKPFELAALFAWISRLTA